MGEDIHQNSYKSYNICYLHQIHIHLWDYSAHNRQFQVSQIHISKHAIRNLKMLTAYLQIKVDNTYYLQYNTPTFLFNL